MDIVSRVKNIITSPNTEWPVIAAEPADVGGLYTGYIAPLAAIGAVIGLIAALFIGQATGLTGILIVGTILQYLLGLISIYVVALILGKLAPNFGGRDDLVQALKLLAYSYTPTWIASILLIVPVIGALVVLAGSIYGIYLLYLGVNPVLGIPRDKAVLFTVLAIVIAIVVDVVFYLIAGRIAALA